MIKEKLVLIRDFFVKNGKYFFPVIIVAAVAIAVFLWLRTNNGDVPEELVAAIGENVESTSGSTEESSEEPSGEVPLEQNTNDALFSLVATYYNAYANGDIDTIKSISNHMDETDEIKIPEMSQYIDSYPVLEVYTKPGPVENSYLVYVYYQMTMQGFKDAPMAGMETFYVCTDANGNLYMNEGEVDEKELEYIETVSVQDDVVELYNRVNVECSDTLTNNTELYYYIQQVVNDVQKKTGEILAQQNASESAQTGENTGGTEDTGSEAEGQTSTISQEPETTGPVYATATTTVNVRKSDSQNSEKVGKVAGGTKVQVLEQKVNGWSKVLADGTEGYIKSEYLQLAETVSQEAIGMVTATTTVNVRMSASQTAEKIGVLAGGTSAVLLEKLDGWCKINYNGSVGYVKAEYVK